jgi:signal transduction histidine kinase
LEHQILDQLRQQLNHLGAVSTKLINAEDLYNLYPGQETSPTALYYQQLLYETKQSGNLETILILSVDGTLLVDYRINYLIGDSLKALPFNQVKFNEALSGKIPEPELIHNRGEYFLTAYTPIVNALIGDVTGILIIESPAAFFSTLRYFKTGIIYFGLGGLLIIMVFAAIILIAIRQLFKTERILLQQERLAQLGQMAAMVAHEIRNPLSIIKGSADVLKKKYASEDEELFSYIPEEINRLNRLVNDFLQFARPRKLNLKKLDPNELIKSIVFQMNDSNIVLELMENPPKVSIETDAFKQVILNILENAEKSSGMDKKVIIRTFLNTENSKNFLIQIKDNGSGMDESELKEVFKPFYSTRASGSGLGLSITKQLIVEMNGKIWIDSKKNVGTKVYIEFPI